MLYERERKINYEKYIINTTEERYLYDNLTLENLAKIVKPNEIFEVIHVGNEGEDYYIIEVYIERYETDSEQERRIKTDELYNKNRLLYLSKKETK